MEDAGSGVVAWDIVFEETDHLLTVFVISPSSPDQMDWSTHFPAFKLSDQSTGSDAQGEKKPPQLSKQVEIADIGCGFGGLIVALSPLYPDTLMIGEHHPSSRIA